MQAFNIYMYQCELLAQKAADKGNSAVGSLLLFEGKIIAKAEETATSKEDVSCHAEMEAIRKARKVIGRDMSGAILVTTKEPCVMCSYAIRYHNISTVVFKHRSDWLGGYSSSFNLLTSEIVPDSWAPPVACINI